MELATLHLLQRVEEPVEPTEKLLRPPERRADDFSLRDGDTVVLYGDSITAQQLYTQYLESYVVTRFPERHIKFVNSGWDGDLVTGGLAGDVEVRLRRDVLPYKPAVVTVLFGTNDGYYSSYNEGIFQLFAKGLTHIVETLHQKLPGVRVTLLTPPHFDYEAVSDPAKWGLPPDYNDTLVRFSQFVHSLGLAQQLPVVSLNALMGEATAKGRARNPEFTLTKDGLHPNAAGHLLIAAATLRAWNAPTVPAEITLAPGRHMETLVSLPWPVPVDNSYTFDLSPLLGSLTVLRADSSELASPAYTLTIDGQNAGTFTRAELEGGVPVTEQLLPSLYQQAQHVADLIQERTTKWQYLWSGEAQAAAHYPAIAHFEDRPSPAQLQALLAIQNWLDEWRVHARILAQPQPHTFLLQPATCHAPRRQPYSMSGQ